MIGVDTAPDAPAAAPRYYRVSVLLTGLLKMWRAVLPAGLVVVANAVAQAALTFEAPATSLDPAFLLRAGASALLWLITMAVLTAAALAAATGRARFLDVFARTGLRFGWFTLWLVPQVALVAAGSALYTLPGLLISWLTVYLPLAAMAGHNNALAANVRAIAARPVRWAVTGVVVAVLGVVGVAVGAVNWFFISGVPAAALGTLGAGLVSWWLLTAWACLFRSTPAGR